MCKRKRGQSPLFLSFVLLAEERHEDARGDRGADDAMGPNVAGVIGSAIAAGFLLAVFG